MRCEKMKDIILTDYIDGRLKGDALREVESHLSECPDCRRLAEDAKSTSSIFRALPRQEASAGVWRAIQAEISAAPQRPHFVFNLPRLRPAFVITATAVMLFFVLMTARLVPNNGYLHDETAQDDIFLISSINGGEDEEGFGTPAEDLFL